MAPKRPSKAKRANQNRNQRAARQARAANAQASYADLSADSGEASPSSGGSLLSKLRGGGAQASGARASSARPTRTRPSLKEARSLQPPGYRAALSGIFAAVAAIFLCTFALRYPVDAAGDLYTSETVAADWAVSALEAAVDQPEATAAELADSIHEWTPGRDQETVIKALWPFSLAIFLPLIGAGIAFWAVRNRSSSRIVNRALYATLFGAILTQGLLLLFIPVVLAIGVAMFQVRKAETVAAATAAAGAPSVIDVEEVDSSEAR